MRKRTSCFLHDDKVFITISRNGPKWTDGWSWSVHLATRLSSPMRPSFVIGDRLSSGTASFRVLAKWQAVDRVEWLERHASLT